MPRHFLDLDGAATLETEHYVLTGQAIEDALQECAMAVVHGDAGLGKTFAVEAAFAAPLAPLLWVSYPSRPTSRLIAAALLERLTGQECRRSRFEIITRLVGQLSTERRVVVVDESQLLTPDGIELLRYLHDRPTTQFALVLVGGERDLEGAQPGTDAPKPRVSAGHVRASVAL